MVLTLIQNVALVVLLATAQRYLARGLDAYPRLKILAAGSLYGSVAAVGMLMPFDYIPGLIYDGRSIIIGLAGLFGGAPVALIAGAIASVYRLLLGGTGVSAGIVTVVASGVLGVGMRWYSRGRPTALGNIDLIAFGLAIHIAMLVAQYTLLPPGLGSRVVRELGPLLLTLFPFATALAARLMIEQLEREQARTALVEESRRLHLAMSAADEGAWEYDLAQDTAHLSAEAATLMGLGDAAVSLSAVELIASVHPDDRSFLARWLEEVVAEHEQEATVHFRWRHTDGRYRWYRVLGAASERDAKGAPVRVLGIITDVTQTQAAAEALEHRAIEAELLAASSERLLRAHDREAVFDIIHDFFAAALPQEIVIVNEVAVAGDYLTTREIVGVTPDLLHWAERILGWRISERRFPITPEYRDILTEGRMKLLEGGLAAIAGPEITHAGAAVLERTLGIEKFWSLGIADSYVAYAGIHVLTRDPEADIPFGVVESFANLCLVTLSRLFIQSLLVESEERFRALIEQTDQGISVGHPDGRVLVYNRAMENISGYTREEVVRTGWFDLAFPTPERRAEALRIADEALRGGLPYVETEIVTKGGVGRWVSVATTPVSLGGDTFSMSIFTDITPRKEAEQALRESEERFRTLVDTAPEAIFVQTERRFAYVNQALVRLYGARSADELLGQPVMDRFGAEHHGAIAERISGLNDDRQPQPAMEMRHIRMDETSIEVETSGAPIVYGGLPGAVVFVRDVTEAKRSASELDRYRGHLEDLVAERTRDLEAVNARLQRTTDAKMALFANLSHELRTPLNSIIGFSAVLQQRMTGPLTEEQALEVGMINSAGKHLLSIINDLLDLTRAEAGRMRVDRERFDAVDLLLEVSEILRPLAVEGGLDLRITMPTDSVYIESDRMKVKRILLNLGGNAVKFTGEGHVELRLTADEAGGVCFSVLDTGRGIRPDQIPLIFEPFSQIDVESGLEREGTGLGLTISRELARLLGGEIHVTSEHGKGSTFSLTLSRPAD